MSTPVSGMEMYGENLMLRHANNPLEDHTDLKQSFLGTVEATRLENRGPYDKETGPYLHAMKLQKYRRGILLGNGLVGTGPKTAEIGDAVAIFKGAKFPYVLRGKEKGGLIHWTLVDAAYIYMVSCMGNCSKSLPTQEDYNWRSSCKLTEREILSRQ
jgi:hypothetical protein